MKALDLWLRSYWSFWDTHGTRLIGVISTLYAFGGAILVAVLDADSKLAAAIMAGGGALGWMTHSRGATNAGKAQTGDPNA